MNRIENIDADDPRMVGGGIEENEVLRAGAADNASQIGNERAGQADEGVKIGKGHVCK